MTEQQPPSRPQPRYGELAPEGWSWTPPEDPSQVHRAASTDNGQSMAPAPNSESTPGEVTSEVPNSGAPVPTTSIPAASRVSDDDVMHEASRAGFTPPAPQAPAQPAIQPATSPSSTTPVAGVPHNLGVGNSATPGGGAQQPQQSASNGQEMPSYRAAAPTQAPMQVQGQTGRGDRIATIVLLVIATLGALYFAMSMMILTSSFNLIASVLEIDNFTVPASVQTLGTTGALILLALYAVMLLFSIQRLRARKLAFWIPLAAGVLAVIIVIAITMIAISQMPQLLDALSDPNVAARLLNTGALLGGK